MVQELRFVTRDSVRSTVSSARGPGSDATAAIGSPGASDTAAPYVLLEALSHELRTTLALISGYSQTLLHLDLEDDERERYLARISIASEHVAELTEEMLAATASSNGGLPSREAVAIGSLVGRLERQYAEEADPPQLIVRLRPDLPLAAGDPVWILRVLRSLVSLAAAETHAARAVLLDGRPTGDWLVVTVGPADPSEALAARAARAGRGAAGRGAASPSLPARAPASSSTLLTTFDGHRARLGHGLELPGGGAGGGGASEALNLCRQLVEAHGGRIWLDETPAGNRVSFSLPRFHAESMPVPVRSAADRPAGVARR